LISEDPGATSPETSLSRPPSGDDIQVSKKKKSSEKVRPLSPSSDDPSKRKKRISFKPISSWKLEDPDVDKDSGPITKSGDDQVIIQRPESVEKGLSLSKSGDELVIAKKKEKPIKSRKSEENSPDKKARRSKSHKSQDSIEEDGVKKRISIRELSRIRLAGQKEKTENTLPPLISNRSVVEPDNSETQPHEVTDPPTSLTQAIGQKTNLTKDDKTHSHPIDTAEDSQVDTNADPNPQTLPNDN